MKSWSLEGVELEIRDSGVHGTGVFARGPLRAGAKVLHLTGRVVVTAVDEVMPDGFWAVQVAPGVWLAADPDAHEPDDFTNHSCEPNLGFVRGTLTLHALRDIAPGEELVWDYSTSMDEPGWEVPCRCGTPSCRGRIQSFRALSPADQSRLRPFTLNYLRR
ncbi:MAG: SET domain-containing protein-lysine N-methyltransferase [Polyangia bacterium]